MNVSEPFIRRPVGTSLLAVAVLIAGFIAYFLLPVSPLPEVEFPTISVQAGLPGASPETMASAVATPLERQFGRIAGITEMTSTSQLGSTQITMQFDLSHAAIKGSKLVIIPQSAHIVTVEQPVMLNRAIADFLVAL